MGAWKQGFLLKCYVMPRREAKGAWTRAAVVVAHSVLESGLIDVCRQDPDSIY